MRRTSPVIAALASLPFRASAVQLDLPIIVDNTYSVIELDVGTPAKAIRFVFDTGSATTWAVDETCATECRNFSGYDRVGYNVSESSSGELTGDYGEIYYVDGDFTAGPTALDKFAFGDVSWNQTFLSTQQTSWGNIPADGFMGLAFSTITVGETKTVVETLLKDLDEPRFGIYYSAEDGDNSNGPGKGRLTIGGSHEEDFVDGDMVSIPIVESNGQYEVWRSLISGISTTNSGNVTTSVPFDTTGVVFDTGAGSIQLPEAENQAVYESLGWNYEDLLDGKRVLMCDEFNSSWSVSFSFHGLGDDTQKTVTLTGEDLIHPGFPAKEGACWPPFQAGSFSLFGTPFLKKFYSVWDFGGRDVESYSPTLQLGKLKKNVA